MTRSTDLDFHQAVSECFLSASFLTSEIVFVVLCGALSSSYFLIVLLLSIKYLLLLAHLRSSSDTAREEMAMYLTETLS